MLGIFHRSDRPPAEVLAQLPKDERVVSWGDTASGSVVIATPTGLWWPGADGQRCIGWQYINKAVWQGRALVVTEAEVVDDMLLRDKPDVAVELAVPRDLPPTVRKRIEANVVRSELLGIFGGQARFVARRIPGADGVQWWARLEGGTKDSPQVRSAISARLAILRSEWEAETGSALRW
jgi:hypothetical protein